MVNMEFTKEEEKVLINKLVNNLLADERITEWERNFLSNISTQTSGLSVKQLKILSEMKQRYIKSVQ